MSYEQLFEHAVQLERSAVIMDMRQRGFDYDKGENRFTDATFDEATIRQTADLTAARFAGVTDLFTPFMGMPDPQAFRALLDTVAKAAMKLNLGQASLPHDSKDVFTNPELDKIDDVKDRVQDWTGDAGRHFRDEFLSPLPAITSNQFALVMALRGGIEAEAAMWREARKNVDEVAHQAQASLDAMLDCNPKSVTFALTVVGSIFSIGASVASGGLAVGLTIVGQAAATGAAVPMAEPEKVQFGGRNVSEIINGVQSALGKLKQQIITAESVIRDAMTNAMSVMSRNQDKIIAPRPRLADATATTVRDDVLGLGKAYG